ncbi:hypothetical protein [uncultured Halomonas sp.]|uniref:hypothetical protein n=1 Tax=uncultured Halomonas sp. TaxID=173971 RepID=UPI002634C654|nr:hypothetical protein [uncultured Halomonas sp.]
MRIYDLTDLMEKPKTFDEQMKEGASLDDGLAGGKPMFEEWEKPYRAKHNTTRCNHEEDSGSY